MKTFTQRRSWTHCSSCIAGFRLVPARCFRGTYRSVGSSPCSWALRPWRSSLLRAASAPRDCIHSAYRTRRYSRLPGSRRLGRWPVGSCCLQSRTTTIHWIRINVEKHKNALYKHSGKKDITRRELGGAHVPPTKVFRRLTASVNETIVKPRVAAAVSRKTILNHASLQRPIRIRRTFPT